MKPNLIFALGLFLFSCSTTTNDKVDIPQLKEEVMAIHDEVMPKMGELRKISKDLRLAAEKDSTKSDWMETANRISNANESMMSWMRGFEPNFEGPEDEVAAYLKDQKVKIAKVRDEMNASLSEGKDLLSENP